MAEKTGLVLEGGALKGIFTCGILDVFMEKNISFDGIVGVSAGAVFGCNLKSHQAGRALRYNKRFARDRRYASWWSFFKTGDFYGADFCYRELPEVLDVWDAEAFKKDKTDFHAVTTDVISGKPHYQKLENGNAEDIQWLRASATVPIVSRICELNGGKYLDGGLSDEVPLKFFEGLGYKKNIVILTNPLSHKEKYNPLLYFIEKLFFKKYPELLKTMKSVSERNTKTFDYINEQEKLENILVIRPPYELPIGAKAKDEIQLDQVYELGRITALERLEEIKEFLKVKKEGK
jgi:predicted patatin/cPLA2 family phospholipase